MTQLRHATPADLPEILSLVRELAEYEQLADSVVATLADLERGLFGNPPQAHCILAVVEGKVAGFALYYHTFSTFRGKPGIYLEDLFVRPEYRRRGIARQFFKELAKRALAMDGARLEWAVLDWNEPALKFYREMGAVPNAGWTTQRVQGEALEKLAG